MGGKGVDRIDMNPSLNGIHKVYVCLPPLSAYNYDMFGVFLTIREHVHTLRTPKVDYF